LEMPFDKLVSILKEAKILGTQHVAISGGEPLFYRRLFDLISECKKKKFKVALNTNGSLLTSDMVNKLIDSGLNSIYISLDYYTPNVHNYLRRALIWEKAVSGLQLLIKAKKKKQSNIIVGIRSMLTKYLIRDLDQMILFGIIKGVDAHQLSYVEYDKKALLTPRVQDVVYFRRKTLPKIKSIFQELELTNRAELISNINCLFEDANGRNYCRSIYGTRNRSKTDCSRPYSFMIILQNGDVAPCNLVEYTHRPIIGNIYRDSLKNIWEKNPILEKFRQERFEDCQYCPMTIHQKLNYYEGYRSGLDYNEKLLKKSY